MKQHRDVTRREVLKKAAYAAPVILTLQATSSVAKAGSVKESQKPKKQPVKKR
jgi:hypothetical protein